MWAMFVVLAYTGLRISEASGLQWEDIDLNRSTIDVNKQLYGSSVRNYSFIPPKNDQSESIPSFGDTVAKAPVLLKEWQHEKRLTAKIHKSNSKVTEQIYLHVTKQRQFQIATALNGPSIKKNVGNLWVTIFKNPFEINGILVPSKYKTYNYRSGYLLCN